ncbi:tRNA (adenosine(37)-N6)-threonylcarbamoyltransferase complex dimerization subunit type 1 TsaB [Microbacterium sp. cx-55]|uniref:tRNA (adenosine(37)-N6)-threonylcarbamoyltransferase complex dimerization subunit type 1 TsaB n=1 Tax=Microbacterium sp. cx-55 TaxID=2875948 RepID=UPI001CC0E219|nr:tRNA (adenosine(37)-N6)-threonylcarbamoyltransferase complex dimerization subunit type 1 TsaB [Microbacterium sp. cx-55]MBZ4486923.1 tRNA (adenosine(37)-N6)-threonylcarbamoyltransferase complex dimerization subunit type 1 TsaB [Microbacterium sp. cx-55]UGB35845.1 tRNA (adenosine(37)-N6)-threonylcarbamoyltransferase complex dimerization subunit type 1 TsaB [Microbacterium sp. cx-55]
MILGIDTSLGTAVALVDPDGVVRAEVASDNPLGHAEVIGDLLVQATEAARTTAAHGSGLPASGDDPITHVVAGMGPGPFTGLRIGIAAARTFALARAIPVIPVPSHDAVALGVLLAAAFEGAEAGRFAVVTDARRKEFAYTVYLGLDDDGLPVRVAEPALVPRDLLDDRLRELDAARIEATSVSAALLAITGARAVAARRSLAGPEPLYLRSPDVTVAHAPKRVS